MKAKKKWFIALYYFFMAFAIVGLVFMILALSNWKYISGSLHHEKFYTQEEVDKRQEELVLELKDSKDSLATVTLERDELNISVNQLKNERATLQTQVSDLQSQVEELSIKKTENEAEINRLNSEISTKNELISSLQQNKTENEEEIANLTAQVNSLTEQVNTLTQQKTENLAEIERLTAELATKTSTIEELNTSISEKEETITSLNAQILSLQNEVTRLTGLLAGYEEIKNGTFEVSFYSDETLCVTKVVKYNKCVEDDIENPTKTGYLFDGWSLDGVNVIDYKTITITQNTVFKAVYTKAYNVVFVHDKTLSYTSQVRAGTCTTPMTIENTTYKIFNGWKVNGEFVDVSTYVINQDTTFVADYTYKYDVTFKFKDQVLSSQIVQDGQFATAPTVSDESFSAWTLNGSDTVDVSATPITENTEFIGREKTWTAIYTNSTGIPVGVLDASLRNYFPKLKTNSIFRVSYSCLYVCFKAATKTMDGYIKSDGVTVASHNFENSFPTDCFNGTVLNNEVVTINSKFSNITVIFNLKLNCVKDGKLNEVFNVVSGGNAAYKVVNAAFYITKIEIYE